MESAVCCGREERHIPNDIEVGLANAAYAVLCTKRESRDILWGCRAQRRQIKEPRLNLSGSWQQGHSATYNTLFASQVVCGRFIARGQGKAIARGSCGTFAHGCPRAVENCPSGMDSNLEAFSYNPAHGSVAASPFPAAAVPMVRIGGSSRTEPNYRWRTNSSRVKLTCLTTV